MSSYDARPLVTKGALLLDEKFPGWQDKIDLEKLNIRYANLCVLAQVYGYHYTGLRTLGLSDGIAQGFKHDDNIDVSSDEQYAALASEWSRAIEERRGGA